MIALVWLGTIGIVCLLWPVFAAEERQTIRHLTMDEKAAWGRYRIEDQAKVYRMKCNREYARHMWDLNRQHAEAIRIWRTRNFGGRS